MATNLNIKKGDTVRVIAGSDRGVEGKVISVLPEQQRVIVEGVNRVKRHTKVVQQGGRSGTTGGIVTQEARSTCRTLPWSSTWTARRPPPRRLPSRRGHQDAARRLHLLAHRSVRIAKRTDKEI
jgi:large subunit ribosomal protein L24